MQKKYMKLSCFFVAVLFLATTVSATIIPQQGSNVVGQHSSSDLVLLSPISVSGGMTYEQHEALVDSHPYFLEDTILGDGTIVLVTEDGVDPADYGILSDEYDICITFYEHDQIINDAEDVYEAQYGISPYPSESTGTTTTTKNGIQSININTINTQSQDDIMHRIDTHSNDIDIINSYENICEAESRGRSGTGPHAIAGIMILRVFIARDSAHKPHDPSNLISATKAGWQRFGQFNIATLTFVTYGRWSAADVGTDASDILHDLEQDTARFRFGDWMINLGIVRTSNHNGKAWLEDFYAFIAEVCPPSAPKSQLVQHELTHAIGGIEDDPWPDCYTGWHNGGWNSCLVNYFWLYWPVSFWCETCWNVLYDNIHQL